MFNGYVIYLHWPHHWVTGMMCNKLSTAARTDSLCTCATVQTSAPYDVFFSVYLPFDSCKVCTKLHRGGSGGTAFDLTVNFQFMTPQTHIKVSEFRGKDSAAALSWLSLYVLNFKKYSCINALMSEQLSRSTNLHISWSIQMWEITVYADDHECDTSSSKRMNNNNKNRLSYTLLSIRDNLVIRLNDDTPQLYSASFSFFLSHEL